MSTKKSPAQKAADKVAQAIQEMELKCSDEYREAQANIDASNLRYARSQYLAHRTANVAQAVDVEADKQTVRKLTAGAKVAATLAVKVETGKQILSMSEADRLALGVTAVPAKAPAAKVPSAPKGTPAVEAAQHDLS